MPRDILTNTFLLGVFDYTLLYSVEQRLVIRLRGILPQEAASGIKRINDNIYHDYI